ncbi:MAG TPA: methyltransferase domain-containing protein [Wenzhouxiangellaceae bacterium]|nr:methyltransferase domain-containing protein [Wenzhouxiangellaceae bacterium]
MNNPADAIKTMKLYSDVERVDRELRAIGKTPHAPLAPSDLAAFDQLHYGGTEAVDEAIRRLGIETSMRIIDIGSGLGGPARHMASTSGCRVTAVELQRELHASASRLTLRCGLDHRIEHLHGDFLRTMLPVAGFDALVSWLTFLHIPDKTALLHRCRSILKNTGRIYIEDFFRRGPLTAGEVETLATDVYCTELLSADHYRRAMENAGFQDVELIDMSADWTAFVAQRRQSFASDRVRFVHLHGPATFGKLDAFYQSMQHLFEGGNLGGLRITARVG